MTIEITEIHWLDQHGECSLQELAAAACLPDRELLELIELGVLQPLQASPAAGRGELRFPAASLGRLRSLRRLREDFELDQEGLSVALALLERIDGLERELRAMRALLPQRRS